MMQDVYGKLNHELPWQKPFHQVDPLHKQTGLKRKEETIKELQMGYSFVWCWNLNTSDCRSEILGQVWSVVLEKDGEEQLDRSYEKLRSITGSRRREISYKSIKRRSAKYVGHILR